MSLLIDVGSGKTVTTGSGPEVVLMDVYGLIGDPVDHSLSPVLQKAAFEARGIDARYVTLEPRREELGTAIEGAEALGFEGLNVTVPFKESVLEYVAPDELAARIGAVNTIDFSKSHQPRGFNTDAEGVRRALRSNGVELDGSVAVVLGAGGAGKAIAVSLADAGAVVRIANRTLERAEDLAETIDGTAHDLETVPSLLEDADLLVNATSVGMKQPNQSPIPATVMHAGLTVLDAVYQPVETQLLRDAAVTGAKTVPGTEMLLYQGVAAFQHWTGLDPPIDAMAARLHDRL